MFDTTALGGGLYYPFAQARDLLTFFADYSADPPDELNVEPSAFVMEDGQRVISLSVTYAGDPAKGGTLLPRCAFSVGPPRIRFLLAYTELQTQADEYYSQGTLYS